MLNTILCSFLISISVMSYNMRYGTAKDGDHHWNNRKIATPAMLKAQSPDLIGVQECFDFQAEFILNECPEYEGYGIGREVGFTGERTEIFWKKDKFELLDKGTFWLSETPSEPSKGWNAKNTRTATWVILKLKRGGKELLFVNTHLDHISGLAREKGLALIEERIDSLAGGRPVILTGDFNIPDDNQVILDLNERMTNARLSAKRKGPDVSTFTAFGKRKDRYVIDYIYYQGFRRCRRFSVIDKSYKNIPYISDHYPIIATLKF
jgi:endonuclease/exonuclease/phosphatase family metal-dependent hydrolase